MRSKVDANSTLMSNFGTTYDINAINNALMKTGVKPLTPAQVQKMSPQELKRYLKATSSLNRKQVRKVRKLGREFRKDAKVAIDANHQEAKLMHGTIRQALGELGTLGAQALGTNAITKRNAVDAITQNTSGGTEQQGGSSDSGYTSTEHGPVRYSRRGRDEE